MSFFAQQTEIIDVGGGNAVTLRKLTYADVLAMMDDPRWDKTSGIVTAEKALVSWSGPDFDNRPATPDNLAQLPFSIARQIAAAADKMTFVSKTEGEASGVGTN